MGTADRIERERHEKRTRILEAARELFVERGVEAVTLREIAQRIEYSTTAIYVQFKDKAALVEAMVHEDFAKFAAALEAVGKVSDPVKRLAALHEAYIDFAMRMPRHYQLLFLTPPAGAAAAHDATASDSPAGIEGYRVLHTTIADCIQAKRFRKELVDVDAIAQTVWATVHGLVALQIVKGGDAAFHWRSRTVLTKQSLDILLHGLLRR